MKRPSLWGAWLAAVAATALSVTAAVAAPPAQDATPTPTPSRTPYFGPTWTPTPTLLPIPEGAGRVAASEIAVRVAPSQEHPAMGRIVYGEVIHAIYRSENGDWVAIVWEDQIGWIFADLVEWYPGFDPLTLPIVTPPAPTPTPSTQPRASTTPEPSEAPSDTPIPTETPTPEATEESTNTPSPVPSLSPQPAVTETATAAAVAVLPATPPATQIASPPITIPPVDFTSGPALWLVIGVPIGLAVASYGWRFIAGQRELGRYSAEFPVETCPACQVGKLQLEESVRRSLGVAQVTRTVRCNTCRSVLRQVQPGVWRYSIDPMFNPRLAEGFNGRHLTDPEFQALARQALVEYPAEYPEQIAETRELTDEEILAELELRAAMNEPEITEPSAEGSDDAAEETPDISPPQEP